MVKVGAVLVCWLNRMALDSGDRSDETGNVPSMWPAPALRP